MRKQFPQRRRLKNGKKILLLLLLYFLFFLRWEIELFWYYDWNNLINRKKVRNISYLMKIEEIIIQEKHKQIIKRQKLTISKLVS